MAEITSYIQTFDQPMSEVVKLFCEWLLAHRDHDLERASLMKDDRRYVNCKTCLWMWTIPEFLR